MHILINSISIDILIISDYRGCIEINNKNFILVRSDVLTILGEVLKTRIEEAQVSPITIYSKSMSTLTLRIDSCVNARRLCVQFYVRTWSRVGHSRRQLFARSVQHDWRGD